MSTKKSSQLISLHGNDLYLLDLNKKTSSKLDLPFTLPSETEPVCILHSRGMLCITLKDNNELAVWTPGSKEFKRIPKVKPGLTTNLLGFGYDQVSDDYKIVTIVDGKTYIYAFKQSTWRESVPVPSLDCKLKNRTGTVVDHCMYWIGDRSHIKEARNNILCFDFAKEEYQKFKTPFYVDDSKFSSWLGVLEEDFCLIEQFPRLGNDIAVWRPERVDNKIKGWKSDPWINVQKSLKGSKKSSLFSFLGFKKLDVGFVCIARDSEVFMVVKGSGNGEDKVMVYDKVHEKFNEISFGSSLKGFRCMTDYSTCQ